MKLVERVGVCIGSKIDTLLIENVDAFLKIKEGNSDACSRIQHEGELHFTTRKVVLTSEEFLECRGSHQDRLGHPEDLRCAIRKVRARYGDLFVLVVGGIELVYVELAATVACQYIEMAALEEAQKGVSCLYSEGLTTTTRIKPGAHNPSVICRVDL